MCWVQVILLNYWIKSSLSLLNLIKCYFKVSKNYHFLRAYYQKCQKTTCSKYLKSSYFYGFNAYNIYMFASTSISTHWALNLTKNIRENVQNVGDRIQYCLKVQFCLLHIGPFLHFPLVNLIDQWVETSNI